MQDRKTDLIGQTLAERYTIHETIGRGGMSVVFRAHDTSLGRDVAVKVIEDPSGGPARPGLRERFRREAAAAASIPPHPNLVHIYDYGTDAVLDVDFIAMELLRGRDLKAALAQGPIGTEPALRVLRDAARGLAAGHRASLVHRDVKPANLFLVGDQQIEGVRLLDFGIAKALEPDDDLTLAGEVAPHSPAYASPEQLRHASHVTPASDVYQLGLVAYELLSGTRPFTAEERERARRGEHVELPARGGWARLPAEIRGVVARCLATEPADRYADAAEFAEALARTLDGGTAAIPDPASASPPAPPDDDHTLLDPAVDPARPAGPAMPAGVAVTPTAAEHPAPARFSVGPRRTATWLAAGVVVFALAWIAVRALGGGDGAPAEPVDLDFAALDEEFAELQFQAARALNADATPEGAAAAEQVERVIADLYQAWADSDMNRFGAHYADRVDFHGRSRVRRSQIVRDRQRERDRFDEVDISLDRQAIEFPASDRARALVDRSWRLRGPDMRWEGAARQQLVLELQQGRWLVTAEDELEVFHSDCTGC